MYRRSLSLSPASLPLCFFLREFFSRVLLSERLEQATVAPTNPIPILLLSFVSQTVVFKLLDFQLRMFKKFIIKTFVHLPQSCANVQTLTLARCWRFSKRTLGQAQIRTGFQRFREFDLIVHNQ